MSNGEIKKTARVLIISWSPVPTPKYQKIEGSGQRFFGLATGLLKNDVTDITIAVAAMYPLDVEETSGFKLINYDLNADFAKKLAGYDTIIFNYTINGAAFISEHLPKHAQVIIDAYGPAYVENLARNPEDMAGTYIGNLLAVKEVFNKVLPRGDYFLYANEAQEKLYTGVLATLGVINQFSYHTKRLLCVPFGIDKPQVEKWDNPYSEYGVKDDDFVLLWFGGLYPWFDITKILESLKHEGNKNLKFVIVGGNNPQNQHPDFVKHYQNALKYIKDHDLKNKVVLIDWVDFATRRKYYEHADVIISMNSEGKENVYSWRTRVMDYVGSNTPLITNGGDPLSDELIKVGAAFYVDSSSENSVGNVIDMLVKDPSKIVTASKKMNEIQPKYYWEKVTQPLAEVIKDQTKPYEEEQDFRAQNGISEASLTTGALSVGPKRSIRLLTRKLIRKIRRDGLLTTYIIVRDKVERRVASRLKSHLPVATKNQKPRLVVVSSQLNNTGAPFVIMDLLRQLKLKHPDAVKGVKLICFTPIDGKNVVAMRKEGLEVEVYTNRELSLNLNEGDTVILNTFAISKTTLDSIFDAVNSGYVKKIYWYGHEASPDGFIDESRRDKIRSLLQKDILKIYSVSEQTNKEYAKYFGINKNIEKMLFRFQFPQDKFRVRKADDFDTLRFTTTGSLMDMRKGQYPIVYAFLDFYHNYYKQQPELYRDFHLELIGAYEKGDSDIDAPYHIRNILAQLKISAKVLDSRFSMTTVLSHDKAIEAIDRANVTICYSLYEAMGIFVYEGMATGHPIIRNESAGQDEQLVDGKNGYAVSNDDFAGLVDTIERMLNKQKTSNEELVKMSMLSNSMAREATRHEYQIIDELMSGNERL
jgi:glycosyltransferase involved in cell wall biosynthesis